MKYPRRQAIKGIGGTLALSLLSKSGYAFQDDSTAKPRVRIGQIGVGHAHANKLSVYRKSPDYEVVGIVEPDAELRKQAEVQEPFRDLRWMTQEELLNVSGLQAVLVETHVRDLLNVAETCVAAGKHVHVDKPAGESLAQFTRILESAEHQKLLLQMGYMYRYNPAVVLLRDFLKRGWLGDVFEVHTVMSKVVDAASRRELAEFRGGIMFEIGCHVIDLVVGVLGQPTHVTAYPRHVGKHDDKLMDNMLAVFEYPHATATVKSSALEVDGGERRHLVVCGTEGTFHIQPLDNPAARVTLSSAREKYVKGYQDITFPKYVRYVDDAADMAKILRGEKESDFAPDHDLAVQTSLLKACGP
ncbi:MAG: Gfo/Idh/MocA family oxidoreductase [Fuerstia sp.]|nr:Gfo/Idh/MocA family oxidoreductase [Fuerstiella sp.]